MKLRILVVVGLLALPLGGCKKEKKDLRNADFTALAKVANPPNRPKNQAATEDLWTAAFILPKWHFLLRDVPGGEPSLVHWKDNMGWMLAFTDQEKLVVFANAYGVHPPDAGALSR